jgi:hypothetical protein
MKGKYPRYDMIGAINFWCTKNGLSYFTYIEKKTKAQLEEIVAQYDINVDEMLFEMDKERNALQESEAQLYKSINNIKGKINMLQSLLNDEQKEKYLEYCDSQK